MLVDEAAVDPLLGTELGRYRIERVLGQGGMGRVYLAIQPAIGGRVAIKVLDEECAKRGDLVDRFFAEARAANAVAHEHVAQVIDLARLPDGRPYIVMEYVDGPTLGALVRHRHAMLGGVVQAIGEVLSALRTMHAVGIVHRDLKPDNVLITNEGHAKVLDFGIAKLAPELAPATTSTGALLGTPAYMSPEQIEGNPVDARTDLYAVGAMLFECVTGVVPFTGKTLFELMRAHVELAPPSPRAQRPDLPVELEQVILRALAKRPDDRYQDAATMAAALAAVPIPESQRRPLSRARTPSKSTDTPIAPSAAHGPTMKSGDDAHAPTTPSAPPAVPRRRWPWLALAAAATGAIVLVAKWPRDDAAAPPSPPHTPAPAPVTAALATPDASPIATPPSPPDAPALVAAVTAAPAPVAPVPPRPAKAPTPRDPTLAAPAITNGSAEDHGVHLGDGVNTGKHVAIGADGNVRRTAKPSYDPKHFDPHAYLATATRLARETSPDAALVEIRLPSVFPGGQIDLGLTDRWRYVDFVFRSTALAARPPGLPANAPFDPRCRIDVEVAADQVVIATTWGCTSPAIAAPRCRPAQIWARAIADGETGGNSVAVLQFTGAWTFTATTPRTYADDCR